MMQLELKRGTVTSIKALLQMLFFCSLPSHANLKTIFQYDEHFGEEKTRAFHKWYYIAS